MLRRLLDKCMVLVTHVCVHAERMYPTSNPKRAEGGIGTKEAANLK